MPTGGAVAILHLDQLSHIVLCREVHQKPNSAPHGGPDSQVQPSNLAIFASDALTHGHKDRDRSGHHFGSHNLFIEIILFISNHHPFPLHLIPPILENFMQHHAVCMISQSLTQKVDVYLLQHLFSFHRSYSCRIDHRPP
jgi:hypothetical protein